MVEVATRREGRRKVVGLPHSVAAVLLTGSEIFFNMCFCFWSGCLLCDLSCWCYCRNEMTGRARDNRAKGSANEP